MPAAQANGRDYCLSAHTYLGLNAAKLDAAEIALNRQGHSRDAKVDAAVAFAFKGARECGKVSDADLAQVKLAGWTEPQTVEIVANVALNVLTNYVSNVAQTISTFRSFSLRPRGRHRMPSAGASACRWHFRSTHGLRLSRHRLDSQRQGRPGCEQ